MVRGVGVSPESGKIEAKLVPFKYLLLLLANFKFSYLPTTLQGLPSGFDTMYLALAERNMQVRFGLKVVWES